ncbi:hypothetical protein EDC01DRAFT_631604 [Geopyxis carbonaria]|nr:hypothetical protein EDC01DRAFT_631604 [Geopyxis carbonaria]
MKWCPEDDQFLLKLLLITHEIKVDPEIIRQAWGVPTARAISEHLYRVKRLGKSKKKQQKQTLHITRKKSLAVNPSPLGLESLTEPSLRFDAAFPSLDTSISLMDDHGGDTSCRNNSSHGNIDAYESVCPAISSDPFLDRPWPFFHASREYQSGF